MSTVIVWQKESFTACSCAMSRVIHQDVVIEAAVHAYENQGPKVYPTFRIFICMHLYTFLNFQAMNFDDDGPLVGPLRAGRQW